VFEGCLVNIAHGSKKTYAGVFFLKGNRRDAKSIETDQDGRWLKMTAHWWLEPVATNTHCTIEQFPVQTVGLRNIPRLV
jgi:hypothetical protein